MMYPEIELAQSIIQICKAKQIKHIIISPGSRNAPLTLGFASDPFFTSYSIVDERCAAFFALGIAQQTKEAVALVCTSGSALLNYYPAVSEAFYSQIPMVVISADRPSSKIDIGDGQTIRQAKVFDNHILYNAMLSEDASVANDAMITNAITTAIVKKGPVHINAPFEEPLYNTREQPTYLPKIHDVALLVEVPYNYLDFANRWNKAKRKLVLVGVNEPNVLPEQVKNLLAEDPSVVVMTETTSNLHHSDFVEHIDRIITSFTQEDFEAFQPELLVTFGGMVISKRIKACLRKYPPAAHWHIDELRHYDTYGVLTEKIIASPVNFFTNLAPFVHPILDSDYKGWIQAIVEKRKNGHKAYSKQMPYCDLQVFDAIMKTLPEDYQLQISNSSAIRYAQLVPIKPSVEVFCNRGTSGIDGSTSTAIGAAVGSNRSTVLVTGDISFFYDSNALWNNYTPKNFKIIVLNNHGGGIFRILPGHQDNTVFNTYFETSHELTAKHLAEMYNYRYSATNNLEELITALPEFWENQSQPAILEVFTPTAVNDRVLEEYFKFV